LGALHSLVERVTTSKTEQQIDGAQLLSFSQTSRSSALARMSEYTQLATADGQAEEIARLQREIEQLEESSEVAADAPPLALEPVVADDVSAHVAMAMAQKDEEIAQLHKQLVVALTPRPASVVESVRRDSVPAAAGARQQELEAENAQLRQVFSAVPLDEEKLQLLLSSVGQLAPEGDVADAAGPTPSKVPSDRTLRETAVGRRIWGNSWFLLDASAFAVLSLVWPRGNLPRARHALFLRLQRLLLWLQLAARSFSGPPLAPVRPPPLRQSGPSSPRLFTRMLRTDCPCPLIET
jgi:hypothetical protein